MVPCGVGAVVALNVTRVLLFVCETSMLESAVVESDGNAGVRVGEIVIL